MDSLYEAYIGFEKNKASLSVKELESFIESSYEELLDTFTNLETRKEELEEELEEYETRLSLKSEYEEEIESDELEQLNELKKELEELEKELENERNAIGSDIDYDVYIENPPCLRNAYSAKVCVDTNQLTKLVTSMSFESFLNFLAIEFDRDTDSSVHTVQRHNDLLEALLDTTYFEQHKNFFEDLYSKQLIDDSNLLALFQFCVNSSTCGDGGSLLYYLTHDHQELLKKMIELYSSQLVSSNESFEKKSSLKPFIDILKDIEKLTNVHIDEDAADFFNWTTHFIEVPRELTLKDKSLLEFIEIYEQLYAFNRLNFEEKRKIFELISENDVLSDKLKDIVNNHLENNYDFESLMSYLKKQEKKNLMNI